MFFDNQTFAQNRENSEKNDEIYQEKLNFKAKNDGLVEEFHDWRVYKIDRGDRFVCYALSLPISENGDRIDRGEPYFIVTNLINDADEITLSSGFIFKKNSDVELSFGAKKFYLFTHIALAWAYSKNDDLDIIKEMQKSEEFTIISSTRDDKIASDHYSLIGFNKAYKKLKEICND